jgi:hypothetical protein
MSRQVTIKLNSGAFASGHDFWTACEEAMTLIPEKVTSWDDVCDVFSIRENQDGSESVMLKGEHVGEIVQ